MRSPMDRRGFLASGVAMCGVCLCSRLPVFAAEEEGPIDPKKLEYCGYTCPKDCKFRTATVNDDEAGKKEAFEVWKITERYGVKYDPEVAFCYGCKAEGKPEGVVVSHCTVRACVREKELVCCIECDELTGCDKDLWKRFPKFHEHVVAIQQRFRSQQAG
jgi:hypothetical protein